MALPFEHLERGFDAGRRSLRCILTVSLRNKSRVPEVGMAAGQPRKSRWIGDSRRWRRSCPGGIERGGRAAQPDIETRTLSTNSLALIESPSPGQIDPGASRRVRGGHRQALGFCPQDHRKRQSAPRRGPEDLHHTVLLRSRPIGSERRLARIP